MPRDATTPQERYKRLAGFRRAEMRLAAAVKRGATPAVLFMLITNESRAWKRLQPLKSAAMQPIIAVDIMATVVDNLSMRRNRVA